MSSVPNSSVLKKSDAASSFKIEISDGILSDLHRRLTHTRAGQSIQMESIGRPERRPNTCANL